MSNLDGIISVLNPDAHLNAPPGPGTRGERRKAFQLYHAFPCVRDYVRVIEVLTEAGLIQRYRGTEVALNDVRWDIDRGHIRVDDPVAA